MLLFHGKSSYMNGRMCLIECLTKGRRGEMPERSSDLRDFYESRVWKIHQISNPYEVVRFRHILEFLGTESRNTVLDVGCGGGTYTRILARAQLVIAVDVSSNAVKTAKQSLLWKGNVFFVVCDLEHLPIRDMAVDKVACIDVLEHVERPQKAVNEMSRVLRSNGKMLLFTACGENKFTLEYMLRPFFGKLINSIRSTLGHVSIFTTQNIRKMLSQDFMITRIEYMHHWAGWLFKFCWDATHMNSLESHQSQFEVSGSTFSRILWLPFEAEYQLFKSRSLGTEIIVDATKKKPCPIDPSG
jgi:ubiquinone/menaquinone biosynthesis C-methylase UbiE